MTTDAHAATGTTERHADTPTILIATSEGATIVSKTLRFTFPPMGLEVGTGIARLVREEQAGVLAGITRADYFHRADQLCNLKVDVPEEMIGRELVLAISDLIRIALGVDSIRILGPLRDAAGKSVPIDEVLS